MKKNNSHINNLVTKILNETLESKINGLESKININELGGMDDDHPTFGKLNFASMTDDEIEALMRRDVTSSEDEENEDDVIDFDDHESFQEVGEGFDDFDLKNFRKRKDYTDKEFKRIPKGMKPDLRNLDNDSITGEKFLDNELKRFKRDFGFDDELEESVNSEIDEQSDDSENVEFCKYQREKFGVDDEIYQQKCSQLDESFKRNRKRLSESKKHKNISRKENKKTVKNNLKLTEDELVDLLEKIVLEEKSKLKSIGKTVGLDTYEKAHKGSGKENEENLKMVSKKMKDYLKDGSKGEYSTNPKIFPQGNGQLSKMSKKAYVPSSDAQDYIDNLSNAGQENLVYDEIHPNEEWIDKNVEGSSLTGNNPEWGNAVETSVNKNRNKIRKNNLLGQIKSKAYNKSPQPIVTDKTGEDKGTKLLNTFESVNDKKTNQINEEFNRMKNLISYNRKTQ